MRWILHFIQFDWRAIYDTVRGLIVKAPIPTEPMPPDRAELFARLHELQTRHAQDAEVREAEITVLTEELGLAQERAQMIRYTVAQKQYAHFCLNIEAGVAVDRLRAGLAEKISMSLSLFIAEIDNEIEVLRRREPIETHDVRRDYTLMKKHLITHTDGPSISRRIRALIQARQRAQEMVLEPLTVEQLTSEILRLKKALPAIASEEIGGKLAKFLYR